MKKVLFLLCAAALILSSCSSVPLTGRSRVMLVSDADVLSSSLSQYSEYMKTATPSTNAAGKAMVQRVGKNIAAAAEKFMTDNGMADDLANYSWEFNLVKDNELNAFCMPGGKIVVYDGLLQLVQSDADLAVVVGHEVAHAVAKHSAERLSQQMLAQYGAVALGTVLSTKSEAAQQLGQTVYGLGANYGVMLPFSRKHESEADYMGIIFMALAGYDPNVAVTFWQKMASTGQNNIPAILSSHPSDEKRIKDLQKNLPKAQQYYHK
ncbi:MAG: M48 family metallopeptidase [Bacteroidaceae bacterium]|nr:M48 family metallopeptidase [Bacteroidaceae bacterium]